MRRIFRTCVTGVLLLLACIFSNQLQAQNRQVKGKVTDDAGLPLPGVNVQLKGTTTVTQTNALGEFTIQIPATGKPELTISYSGYATVTLAAGSGDLSVKMEKKISALDDVVVIGYGSARKRDLTGATSSLPGSTLEKIPLSSTAEAMTGRLAGVSVTTTDGAPGADQADMEAARL